LEREVSTKIEIIKHPSDYDWKLCKLAAITTVGKRRVVTMPNDEWKHKILRARHSPIRTLHFLIRLDGVPSFVATHIARHTHLTPFVQSKRDDLQGDTEVDRWTPVLMMVDINAEELMTLANKRLCGKAHEETRKTVRDMCEAVIETNPEFAPFLVPFCKQYGCQEMHPCSDPSKYLPRR
jgi:hypothetical protein